MDDKTCQVVESCCWKGYPLGPLKDVAETDEDVSDIVVEIGNAEF